MDRDAGRLEAQVTEPVTGCGEVLAQASDELKRCFGVLLRHAQDAGAVRDDIGLSEVYALLIGSSRATAFSSLDRGVNGRALGVIFDGLASPGQRSSDVADA